MSKVKPYSASSPAFGGFLLMAIGIYFVFLRPSLLPEDYKYIGLTSAEIQQNIPQLSIWLQKVFWVMGGYIFTSGLLTIYISRTSFLTRSPGSFVVVILTGISSIAVMTTVNFILDSDFKWIFLLFNLPWVMASILYRFHK